MQWPNSYCNGLRIKRSGFEPWSGHCVVFLSKTLHSHPGGVAVLLAASCYGNWDKFRQ